MPTLIADIGATNARFALVEKGDITDIRVLACAGYPGPVEAARDYLAGRKAKKGSFAVATEMHGTDRVVMTNNHWSFSISETKEKLALGSLAVMNDFTAIAHAVTRLSSNDCYQIGKGAAEKNMPIGIIGPGSGLGVGAVVFADGKPVVVTSEGGHATMAATNEREFALLQWLWKKYDHVSAERVVSGMGLVNLYQAINAVDQLNLPEKTAAEITQAALAKNCAACVETLDLFCHFLGSAAGNLALTLGAFGGIYIAGGIVPQLGDYFKTSRFRASFLAKGRYHKYLDPIPTFVITHPYPGLEGLKNTL